MILVTTMEVPGRRIGECMGLVRGNAVRARAVGRDIQAVLRNLVGGEVVEYTKLLAEAREQAIDRMVAEARQKGADAIVAMRFSSCEVAKGAAELLVYGTAVKLA
jgi:uncharacterized protein YbjQ (UPF0145 family)